MLNTLVQIPIVLGVDWAWHVKFNLFIKSCLFSSLLRLWNICETCKKRMKRSLFHILNGYTHKCLHTETCHGPWNSRVVSLVWPLLASQSSTLSASDKSGIRRMPKFCMPTFCNGRNNSNKACICLFRVQFAKFTSALFLAQTWGKTSKHHLPEFRQTMIAWWRSWHCCICDCFPALFKRYVVEEYGREPANVASKVYQLAPTD